MKRIAKGWGEYRRKVVPENASAVQVDECRRAFYGGCWSLFNTIMASLSDGPDPAEADSTMLEELHTEMVEFANSRRN